MGKSFAHSETSTGKAIIWAFIVSLIIKFFILDFMIAEGNSMFPAIKPGAILPVFKVSYGIRLPGSKSYIYQWALPSEGDVIVFFTPMNEIAVKRCGASQKDGLFYAYGDNSSHSYDSRDYGPVPKSNIIGRVLGIKQ